MIKFVRSLVCPAPVEEVTVVFVRGDATDWIAYVLEMPAVNGYGTSAAQALASVQQELTRFSRATGRKFTLLTKVKYRTAPGSSQAA
jgi:pantoate kinase